MQVEARAAWSLHACESCGGAFVIQRSVPPAETIYDRAYFTAPGAGFTRLPRAAYLLSVLARHVPGLADRSLLDVGCGFGEFVRACRSAGVRAVGMEPMGVARDLARSKQLDLHATLEETPVGSFDIVTIWEVVEHLAEPASLVAAAASRLTTGGKLFLSTPNFGCLRAARKISSYEQFYPPIHLTYFRPEALVALLTRAGLQVLAIEGHDFDRRSMALDSGTTAARRLARRIREALRWRWRRLVTLTAARLAAQRAGPGLLRGLLRLGASRAGGTLEWHSTLIGVGVKR